jgi:hypothetical protein
MPKLTTDVAQKVDKAESGFQPVPEGVYILQLMEDVEVKEGAKGPYWRWTFEVPKEHEGEELEHSGRRFWTNTSLSEAAYFKLQEAFRAFGVPTDTDTEDLVGRRVKAVVVMRTIQQGQRKGELSNEIAELLPLDSDKVVEATEQVPAAATGGKSDEPLF